MKFFELDLRLNVTMGSDPRFTVLSETAYVFGRSGDTLVFREHAWY